ncbi:serine protease, partial [Thermodesulfobacteriota bacterium]
MHGQPGKRTVLFTFFFLILVIFGFIGFSAGAFRQKVYITSVSGTVDPGMAAFIERALRDAAEDPETLFILEMDTFGGRVDSALQIVDALLNIPKGRTIAFVSNKAIS